MSEEYKGQKVLFVASSLHLMTGLDLLASKMSLNASKSSKLLVLEHGVVAISSNTGREVYIPNSNIKGIELSVSTKKGTNRKEVAEAALAEAKAKASAGAVAPKAPAKVVTTQQKLK